ncbi:MAG TPA: outer membrane lipid asymmetry maintenance protein MlaD [Nitrospiraceae bacterium]|jgi:phospholipid/cholesterol/gamma-HCH transport system substrate-binding protein|nr:outer membrane lipid asymmetry maintenance protein MlaD [Nitrospiraceae bacterium]
MKKYNLELAVGFFLLIGIICLGYISVKLGRLQFIGGEHYTVYADFGNAPGIKPGSSVEIAGVDVGRVKSVRLDNYQARVEMDIDKGVKLQEDAIASIKTEGLIGETYIKIAPGASDKLIANGGTIRDTESAIDIEEIIGKYAFGKV